MIETLGHHRILARIGVGRMGELYRARDTRAGRTVAIRVVAEEIAGNPEERARFLAAARATAALSHPNIAALYEIGEAPGVLYLVSEFVPGDTLRSLIAGRALNPRHAIDHGIQIADALAEAHAEGLVHRDLRPGSIIITPKGIAKLVDVGLAGWTGGGLDRSRRLAGPAGEPAPIETLACMSPEQVLGAKDDERTDIFSLGAVLYEMLTGTPPFAATTATAVIEQVLNAQPPAPSTVNRLLPPELDTIVLRMLAKGLDQRYEAAATVAAELRSVAAILDVREEVSEPIPTLAAPPSRKGVVWLLALLLVLGLVAAYQFVSW